MFANIRKKTALLTFLISFIILSLLVLGAYSKGKSDDSEILSASASYVTVEVKTEENTKSYQAEYMEGESVYDLLNRIEEQNSDFTADFQEFDFDGQKSYFITSINGITPDPATQFWKFQVNGSDSNVGISDYVTNSGDTITFVIDTVY